MHCSVYGTHHVRLRHIFARILTVLPFAQRTNARENHRC